MTEHLISQGHEKIALLCSYKEDVSIGALRLTGYKKALEALIFQWTKDGYVIWIQNWIAIQWRVGTA